MTDSYLLGAIVSFIARQKQPPGFQKLISCAFFGSSWSSDTAYQWHAFGCRHLFSLLMFEGFSFLSHPLSFSLSSPPFSDTSVFMDKCPFIQTSVRHTLDRSNWNLSSSTSYRLCPTLVKPNPQPWSAAVGSVAAISPVSKRSALALHFCLSRCTWVTWQQTQA